MLFFLGGGVEEGGEGRKEKRGLGKQGIETNLNSGEKRPE